MMEKITTSIYEVRGTFKERIDKLDAILDKLKRNYYNDDFFLIIFDRLEKLYPSINTHVASISINTYKELHDSQNDQYIVLEDIELYDANDDEISLTHLEDLGIPVDHSVLMTELFTSKEVGELELYLYGHSLANPYLTKEKES